jgi:hypothetical protein
MTAQQTRAVKWPTKVGLDTHGFDRRALWRLSMNRLARSDGSRRGWG